MPQRLPLFAMKLPRIKVLHYTWFAFFVTFLIWFAHVALMPTIKQYFHLSDGQVKAILMLNVALTIPARLLIGAMVDRYGPKRSYSAVLLISGFLCFVFAFAQSFQMLAIGRFLLGFVGAGFVVGIRLISEWFPVNEVGSAEGVYGGWGNFWGGSSVDVDADSCLSVWRCRWLAVCDCDHRRDCDCLFGHFLSWCQ